MMSIEKIIALNLVALLVAVLVIFRVVAQPLNPRLDVRGSKVENVIWFNTKVGPLDFSNLTVREAEEIVRNYQERETLLSFPHRARLITYSDLGVEFKTEVLGDYVRRCRLVDPRCYTQKPKDDLAQRLVVVDEEKFLSFVKQLNEEVKALLQGVDISFDALEFSAHGEGALISVDETLLRSQLTPEHIFSQDPISIETKVSYPEAGRAQREATEALVEEVAGVSLLIKYGRQPVYIPSETLRSFLETTERGGRVVAVVSKSKVSSYLDSLKDKYPLDIELEQEAAVLNLSYALLFRAGGEPPYTAVILPLKGESQTKGAYARKYLELNKTQQRLYAFENGELVDTFIVGTGLTWETPAGTFQILRKEGLAFSYTGGWFMPYYMPIGTINGYFFGFHEIPYRKTAQGLITSRDVNTMGSPATGGCIQLYREDAQKIYEWADIGMPVIIVE